MFLLFYLNVLSECFRTGKIRSNRASRYLPLLKELKAKHACLNIQNNDTKCFLWSILLLLHPVQYRNRPTRVSKYQEYEHELMMSGIQYPVDMKDIGKFEHQKTLVLTYMGIKIKKSFHYVLPPPLLQDIT